MPPPRPKSSARASASLPAASVDDRSIVLFAVTGMSPAVLTETIWALATGTPSVVPSRVVVITTEAGRACLERELFSTPTGAYANVWTALHQELAARGLDVSAKLLLDRRHGIRVFSRPGAAPGETTPLDDIRTAADNELAGDFLLQELRGFTDDDDTRVIASIAGGRKTMGALLYAVMTLVGRDTDRLTHVLVEEPFDNPRLQPKFFFPAQPGGALRLPDGKSANPSCAKLALADVPFVPLREVFPRELGRRPGRFMALVNRYRLSTPMVTASPVNIRIDRAAKTLAIGPGEFRLSARQSAVIVFLSGRAKSGLPPFDRYAPAVDALLAAKGWSAKTDPKTLADEDKSLLKDLTQDGERAIVKALDDIKAKLRKTGTPEALSFLRALPERGRFSLKLPPDAIEIVG